MQQGRPRFYRFKAAPDFASQEIALFNATLDESASRLVDIISPLEEAELDYTVGSSMLSIDGLTRHIVWAEAHWIALISGIKAESDLITRCAAGAPSRFGSRPEPTIGAKALERLVLDLRNENSRPILASQKDPARVLDVVQGPRTVREVLMHLLWHWTYHTGQIGLIRELAGRDYEWRFERND